MFVYKIFEGQKEITSGEAKTNCEAISEAISWMEKNMKDLMELCEVSSNIYPALFWDSHFQHKDIQIVIIQNKKGQRQ